LKYICIEYSKKKKKKAKSNVTKYIISWTLVKSNISRDNRIYFLKMLNETKISQKKIRQQCKVMINLLAEIKLKENGGTQSTIVRVKMAEILTVAMCVSEAKLPFGNMAYLDTTEVTEVRYETE